MQRAHPGREVPVGGAAAQLDVVQRHLERAGRAAVQLARRLTGRVAGRQPVLLLGDLLEGHRVVGQLVRLGQRGRGDGGVRRGPGPGRAHDADAGQAQQDGGESEHGTRAEQPGWSQRHEFLLSHRLTERLTAPSAEAPTLPSARRADI
ncbi:hypothetical protein GCM10027610_018860 [Dactylosporangium cerinum]